MLSPLHSTRPKMGFSPWSMLPHEAKTDLRFTEKLRAGNVYIRLAPDLRCATGDSWLRGLDGVEGI
jgi:hypothetical protein